MTLCRIKDSARLNYHIEDFRLVINSIKSFYDLSYIMTYIGMHKVIL